MAVGRVGEESFENGGEGGLATVGDSGVADEGWGWPESATGVTRDGDRRWWLWCGWWWMGW